MICTDPELAEWDRRMGEAYKQKYARFAGNDRRALIDDQRRWIASRNAQCNQTELPEAESCILQTTKARLAALVQQSGQPLQLVAPSVEPSSRTRGSSPSGVAEGPFEDGLAAYQRGDYTTALRLLRPLADKGDAKAQFSLGVMYDKGQGVTQDYTEALNWYHRAAEQGDAKAQFNLGAMYENGQGVPPDHTQAVKWFRKAADQGIAGAQFNLGLWYVEGQGVPQDYTQAVKWFRKAADQGDAQAQNGLGSMYGRGWGVPQDYTESVKWFRKAAEQGDVQGENSLAISYAEGQGAPQDYAEAVTWFRKAADQGMADAQFNLGNMYSKGQGVTQDFVAAYIWLNLAAARGESEAAEARDAVAQRLTAAQLAEAQRTAAEWQSRLATASPAQTSPPPSSSQKPESETTFGTAFFVSKDGTAVSNAHVVERCQQIRVSINEQRGTARVLGRDDKNDLALLATDLHPAQLANWRLSVRQGEDVVAYGFPLTGVLATGGNVATGNVTALAGLGDDSRFLQISVPVQPGNSGGPLLDRSGNVVGIVVAKLNALGIASATGDIPQNVNFAIKASVAAAFLDAQHAVHSEGQDTMPLSTPDLSERAKAFTAQVVCVR